MQETERQIGSFYSAPKIFFNKVPLKMLLSKLETYEVMEGQMSRCRESYVIEKQDKSSYRGQNVPMEDCDE